MSIFSHENGRVNRSQYWTAFAANIVAVLLLGFGGVAMIVSGSYVLGILMILAMLPVGIYFRVIMMRRCRDIGWPPSLPWITFGLGILANLSTLGGMGSSYDAGMGLALSGLPMLVGLLDFALMIALGSVAGRRSGPDYARIFADDDERPYEPSRRAAGPASREARPMPSDYRSDPGEGTDQDARWDDAIARALAKHRGEAEEPAPAAPLVPGPARPAGGFGRRVV